MGERQRGRRYGAANTGRYSGGVSFLDDVREFLRHPVALPIGDMRRYRSHLLSLLKRLETESADPAQLAQTGRRVRHRLGGFVPALEQRLLAEGVPPADIPGLVEYAIGAELGIRDEPISATYAMIVSDAASGLLSLTEDPWHDVARYAHEIHAVRLRSRSVEITDIGRVLLELTGMEAIRWLLHVETALVTGASDPWRVDRDTLHMLAKNPVFVLLPPEISSHNPHSVHRLAWLGLLEFINEGQHGETTYRVHEQARPILREISEGADTPMSLLVAALLEDDVRGRLPVRGVPSTSQATIRQARYVIHEISNALVPVQGALGRIYKEAERAGAGERIASYRARVDLGIERMLAFARDMKTMARLSGEVKEPFDPGAALRQAAGDVAAQAGHMPDLELPERPVMVFGVRPGFVRAVIDLLRNAYQTAAKESPEVKIHMTMEGKRICVAIDDNGPGVPPEDRDRIFLDGYSTRAQGMGFGLGLARAVIEESMGGTLTCEDGSSLGGARFVITLPRYNGSAQ
jgi:signal transduction histidine kinase